MYNNDEYKTLVPSEFTSEGIIDVFVVSDTYNICRDNNGKPSPIELDIIKVISRNIISKIYIKCGCSYQKSGCIQPFYLTDYGEIISDEYTGIIFGMKSPLLKSDSCRLNNEEYIQKLHEYNCHKYKLVGFNKPEINDYLLNKNIFDFYNIKKYVILESQINKYQLPKSICVFLNKLYSGSEIDEKILKKIIDAFIPNFKMELLEQEILLLKRKFNNLLAKHKLTKENFKNEIDLLQIQQKKNLVNTSTQTD
jgi:hypothetical protein